MAITAYGQNSASVDTLQTASDSTSVGSHAEFSAARQESNVTKAEGDSAYIRNDYASAIQIYENLLKKGEAAEVYYNLGNSYYKADDIARAILNYERALLLEPGNADIRANLEIRPIYDFKYGRSCRNADWIIAVSRRTKVYTLMFRLFTLEQWLVRDAW